MGFYKDFGPNDAAIKEALINETEFKFVHLVKFERPSLSVGEENATSYGYYTDSSQFEVYDDLSIDSKANFNGAQEYIPSKLLKVGDFKESQLLENTSINLTFDATAINTVIKGNFLLGTNEITIGTGDLYNTGVNTSWTDSGFQEGDVIQGVNDGLLSTHKYERSFRIDRFSNNNKTAHVSQLGSGDIIGLSGVEEYIKFQLITDEISTFTSGAEATRFTEYLNRDVNIYRRIYTANESGGFTEVGTYEIFKGLVSNGKLRDDVLKDATMTWTISSHWAAFNVVNGRRTSDDDHRAINNGITDLGAVKKIDYASDLGFMHAEKAFNVSAKFRTKEEQNRVRAKTKWSGKTKVKNYTVVKYTARDTQLNFNLNSEYIPVIYGVNIVDEPITAFADIMNTASTVTLTNITHEKLVTVQVLCEGEISSIIDFHIEDEPVICVNDPDFIARNTNVTSVAARTCVGRADAGNTIQGNTIFNKNIITAKVNGAVAGSKTVTIDNVSGGTIVAGMEISYAGATEGLTIEIVNSQTSIVLDVPVTVGNNVDLTIESDIGGYDLSKVGSTSDGTSNLNYINQTSGDGNFTDAKLAFFEIEGTRVPNQMNIPYIQIGTNGNQTSNKLTSSTNHSLHTGTRVKYVNISGGSDIGGLTNGDHYFFLKHDANEFKLCLSFKNAIAGTVITLSDSNNTTSNSHQFHVDETALGHETGIGLPVQKEVLMFHAGRPDQKANEVLVSVASKPKVTDSNIRPTVLSGTGLSQLKANRGFEVVRVDDNLKEQLGATFKTFVGTDTAYNVEGAAKVIQATKIKTKKSQSRITKYIIKPRKDFTNIDGLSSNNTMDIIRRGLYATYRRYGRGTAFYRLYDSKFISKAKNISSGIKLKSHTVTITSIELGNIESGFKIQNDFFQNYDLDYWGDDHRLLDTAYVVSIKEMHSGETNQNMHKYVVKGKFIDCHSYDGSFVVSSNEANISSYKEGDSVSIGGGTIQLSLNNIIASDIGTNASSKVLELHARHFSGETQTDSEGVTFNNGSQIFIYNQTDSTLLVDLTIVLGHIEVEDVYTDGIHAFVVHETFMSVYLITSGALVTRQVMYSNQSQLGGHSNNYTCVGGGGTPRYPLMEARQKRLVTGVTGDGTYVYVYSPQHIASNQFDHPYTTIAGNKKSSRNDIRIKYNQTSGVTTPGMHYGQMVPAAIYRFTLSKLTTGAKYSQDSAHHFGNAIDEISDTNRTRYWAAADNRDHQIHTYYGQSYYDDWDSTNNDQTLTPWPGKHAIVMPDYMVEQSDGIDRAKAIPPQLQGFKKFNNLFQCYFDTTYTFKQENELPKGCTTDGTTLWVADWACKVGKVSKPEEDGFYAPGYESSTKTMLSNINGFRAIKNDTTTLAGVNNYDGLDNEILIKDFSGSATIYAYNLLTGARDAAKDILPYVPTLSASLTSYDKTVSAVNNRRRFVGASAFSINDTGRTAVLNQSDRSVNCTLGSELTLNNVDNLQRGMSLHFKAADAKSYVYGDFMPNQARATCSSGAKTHRASIEDVTRANPAVFTVATSHAFQNGDKVVFENFAGITSVSATTNLSLYNTPYEISDKTSDTFRVKLNGSYVDLSGEGSAYTQDSGSVLAAQPVYSSRGHLGLNRPVIMAVDSANNKVLLNRFVEIPDTNETVEFGYEIQSFNQFQHRYNDIDRLDHEGSTNTEGGNYWKLGQSFTYSQHKYYNSSSYNTNYGHMGREFGTTADAPYDVSHVTLGGVNCMMILNKHREHIVHDNLRGHNSSLTSTELNANMLNINAETYENFQGGTVHTATEYTMGSHVFCYNIDTGKMFDKIIRVPLGTVGICTYTYSNNYNLNGVVDNTTPNNPTFLYCLVEYALNNTTLNYKVVSILLDFENTYSGHAMNFGRDEKNIHGSLEMKGKAWDGPGWFNDGGGSNVTNRSVETNMPRYQMHNYVDQTWEYGANYTQGNYNLANYTNSFNTNISAGVGGLSTLTNSVKLHGLSVVPGQTYTNSGQVRPVLSSCATDSQGKTIIITNEPTTTARKHYTRDSSTDKLAGLVWHSHGGSNRVVTIEKADFHTTSESTSRQNPVIRAYTDDGDNTLSNYNTFFTDGDDAIAPLGEARSATNKTSVIESLSAASGTPGHARFPASNSFDFVPATDANSVPLLYRGFFLNDSNSAYLTRAALFHEYDYTDTSMSRGSEDLHTSVDATSGVIITDIRKEDGLNGAVNSRITFDSNFPTADVDTYTLTTDGSSSPVILDAKNIFPKEDSTEVIHSAQGKGPTLTLGAGWDSTSGTYAPLSVEANYTALGLENNKAIQDMYNSVSGYSLAGAAFWAKIREGAITYTNGDWVTWDNVRSLKLASGIPARFQKMIYTQSGIATAAQNLTTRLLGGPEDLLPEHLLEEVDQISYRFTPPSEVVEALINQSNFTDKGVDEFITYDNPVNLDSAARTVPQVGDEFLFDGQEPQEKFYVTAINGTTQFKLNKDISLTNSETTRTTHGSTISSGTATITLSSANTAIQPGQRVTASSGIASNTKVLSINGTTLTLDKNTTGSLSAGTTLTFTDVTAIQFLSHQMVYLVHPQANLVNSTTVAQQTAIVASSIGVQFSFDDVIITDGQTYPTTREFEPDMNFRTDSGGSVTKSTSKAVAFDDINSIAIINISNDFAVLGTTQYKFPTKDNKDIRVTTNPALQLLDYLTNDVYGRGLRLSFKHGTGTGSKSLSNLQNDIDFESFLTTARMCDAKSQVTVCMRAISTAIAGSVSNSTTLPITNVKGTINVGDQIYTGLGSSTQIVRYTYALSHKVASISVPNTTIIMSANESVTSGSTVFFKRPAPVVGDIYAFNFGGVANGTSARRLFQGTVYSVTERIEEETGTTYYEIVFDEVSGHLGKRWASWKELNEEIVYNPSGADPLRSVGSSSTIPSTYTASGIQSFNQLGFRSLRMYRVEPVAGVDTTTTSTPPDPLHLDIGLDGINTSFNEDSTNSKGTGATFTLSNFDEDIIVPPAFGFLIDHGGTTRKVTVKSVDASANTVVLEWTGGANISVGNTAAKETGTVNFNLTLTNTGQISTRVSSDGNPVVKSFDTEAASFINSGYSLYDSDHVKYWRHVGWNEQEQKHVTRHQLNTFLDTGATVFDNTNKILQQMNGMLTYSAGKYSLDVKRKQDINTDGSTTQLAISTNANSDASVISEEDIIGRIEVVDKGIKGSFNSIDATITDPGIKFATRTVAFFNSDYLEEDNNMPKKGTYQCPSITNYFNARMNVKQHLDQSRFGLTITFDMTPKGAMLKPGMLIKLNNSRFNFVNKLFRIDQIILKTNGLVSITANEHSDSTYLLEKIEATSTKRSGARCISGTIITVPIAPSDNPDNT